MNGGSYAEKGSRESVNENSIEVNGVESWLIEMMSQPMEKK